MNTQPIIAVLPQSEPLEAAVVEGGGRIGPPDRADALVWGNPRDPDGLRDALATSPARWVQLPFAGIESFFAAGVIDPARTWTCAKGIYGPATAEQAVALILATARRLHEHAARTEWMPPAEAQPMRRIAGETVVVVGTGGIGQALARMLAPFGARIVGVNRSGTPMPGAERTVAVSDLGHVLGDAAWVVVAAALTEQTRGLFDAPMLANMRPDAWLVDVARGGLVVTDALCDALSGNVIAGAALDVTDPEPLPAGHPLWAMPNVIITSHTANTPVMSIPELRAMVARNVARFAAGEPLEGVVDLAAGY